MSRFNIKELPWLTIAPKDFSSFCKKKLLADSNTGTAFKSLASNMLDLNQLTLLAKLLTKQQKDGQNLSPLVPLKIGFLSNGTTGLIVPGLIGSALRHGISLEVIETNFNQIAQEALDPKSQINKTSLDAIVVAIDHRGFPCDFNSLDSGLDAVGVALNYINSIRKGFHNGCGAPIIIQTVPTLGESYLGNLEQGLTTSFKRQIERYNHLLADEVSKSSDIIFDVAQLASTVGFENWHNPVHWHLAKFSFSPEYIPIYSDCLVRILGTMRGITKKCLVLDLDNTLWGGVIGDTNINEIVLGSGTPDGEAFLAIQKMALDLRSLGVLLAVCSKNNKEVAQRPFIEHPEMILKLEHFSAFQANWEDKATNLQIIATQLNLGLDSFVFVDDNPFERSIVRSSLPMVAVPEMPDDPSMFTRVILSAGYFETLGLSREDLSRAEQYQANFKRVELAKGHQDLEDFLKTVEMAITFSEFDIANCKRITQLINKTNQFNLTTNRQTESQVERIIKNSNRISLQIRLKDKFGDYGMISVVIIDQSRSQWTIDTWLMSCRVIKRQVELSVCNELVRRARQKGIKKIIGVFKPSGTNSLVKDHYQNLGFDFIEKTEDRSIWSLNTAIYNDFNPPIYQDTS